MKFSESWLREWVNPTIDSQQLAMQLTTAGLEVDDLISVSGDFDQVIIGEVVYCEQHPDADKLRVTQVNIGKDELLHIVCGAPNCRLGLKVAVAQVGATLPGDFKIKEAKLRGQLSQGMLCSYQELEIGIISDGIIELPKDAPIGEDLRRYLDLDDITIDVDLTANRSDCLNIKGLAREIATLNNISVSEPIYKTQPVTIDDQIQIEIEDPEACPRYLGRIIRNIDLSVSTPIWLTEKLRRSGIRSIDPIVDVTNYVMLELGQPMHAFDLSQLDGGIVVRFAKQAEPLTLLDSTNIELQSNTLVICDRDQPLAIAGIFGGLDSGVTGKTKDILLESAYFTPKTIRARARQYGLHTESSHRFERGIDPTIQNEAMERATQLIIEICGGQVGPIVVKEFVDNLPTVNHVTLRRSKLDSLLGNEIASETVTTILRTLGCEVTRDTSVEESWHLITPLWRNDLAIEEDFIEEVARIYGYDNIVAKAPTVALVMKRHQEAKVSLQKVRQILIANGYNEAITYSFVDPDLQRLIVNDVDPILLPFPISVEMSAMRLSLIPGLLSATAYNQKRQQTSVRLFESGLRFVPSKPVDIHNRIEHHEIKQEQMLAGVISGNYYDDHWQIASRKVDFYDLKGTLRVISELTGQTGDRFKFKAESHLGFHPGQSATIYLDNIKIGVIGAIHPTVEKAYGLMSRAIVFEISWQAIAERLIPEVLPLSKFPSNRRDIAVIVENGITAESLIESCYTHGGSLLISARVFDIYQGEGVDLGHKSVAIALQLQAYDRTLEEQEISETVESIVSCLKNNFNAIRRD